LLVEVGRNAVERETGVRGRVLEEQGLTNALQIGYGSNRKTRHMMPSGHKAFVVNNVADVDLLLMHNSTFAAEYVCRTISKYYAAY